MRGGKCCHMRKDTRHSLKVGGCGQAISGSLKFGEGISVKGQLLHVGLIAAKFPANDEICGRAEAQ